MGLLASCAALAIWAIAAGIDPEMGLFWAYGLAFGFVLQRGRLCFAAAFRDIFLLQHGRTLKAVLAGLAVATIGFGLVMSKQVPNPTLGFLPPTANVLPIGLHLVFGGLIFGFGMVVAGGCVSGSVYRMGEGLCRLVGELWRHPPGPAADGLHLELVVGCLDCIRPAHLAARASRSRRRDCAHAACAPRRLLARGLVGEPQRHGAAGSALHRQRRRQLPRPHRRQPAPGLRAWLAGGRRRHPAGCAQRDALLYGAPVGLHRRASPAGCWG
jgi:hypothetical protein